MAKVCIPESNPASEQEAEWLQEIFTKHGEEIELLEIPELTIIRFFRAYVNDPNPKEKAFTAIQEFIQWRLDENVDDIAATEYESRSHFLLEWPHGPHGISKDGHIIYIDRPGQFNPKSFGTKFSLDEYIKMHIQTMEWIDYIKRQLSERIGRQTYKHVVIMDLNNLGLKHVSGDFTTPLKQLINIDSTKYPETLHHMFVINSPLIFRAIWAMYSPFLDDVTKSRIHLIKAKELLQHIDVNQLPNFLDGAIQYTEKYPAFVRSFRTVLPQQGKRRFSISTTVTRTITRTDAQGHETTKTTTTHAEATTTTQVTPDETTTTTTVSAERIVTIEQPEEITTTTKTAHASVSVTSPTGTAPALDDVEQSGDAPAVTDIAGTDTTPVVVGPDVTTPVVTYEPNEQGHFENDGRFDDIFSFETFLIYQRAKAERVRERRIEYDAKKAAEAAAAAAPEEQSKSSQGENPEEPSKSTE